MTLGTIFLKNDTTLINININWQIFKILVVFLFSFLLVHNFDFPQFNIFNIRVLNV